MALQDILAMLSGGQGGGPGMAPGAAPAGNPMLGGMADFQSTMAPGSGEEEALKQASIQLGIALKAIYLRSPKAAKLILTAMRDIQSAREEISKAGSGPSGALPNLGAEGMAGMMQAPGMGGMGSL